MNYYKRSYFLFLCLLLCFNIAIAQPKMDNRSEIKWFGSSTEGIALFKDSSFLIFGYATLVYGNYHKKGDIYHFITQKFPLFEVYGHYNPQLKDTCRMMFNNFEDDFILVQFNNEPVRRVFNKEPNCFTFPYVYDHNNIPEKIKLTHVPGVEYWNTDSNTKEWTYLNKNKYNEFVLGFTKGRREGMDFPGKITLKNGVEMLTLDPWADEPLKNISASVDEENWKDLFETKEEIDKQKTQSRDTLFFNKHYSLFEDRIHYQVKLDSLNNEWYPVGVPEQSEEWYQQEPFKDFRRVRLFEKMIPAKTAATQSKYNGDYAEIFFTECGNGESYEYEGIPPPKAEARTEILPLLKPNE